MTAPMAADTFGGDSADALALPSVMELPAEAFPWTLAIVDPAPVEDAATVPTGVALDSCDLLLPDLSLDLDLDLGLRLDLDLDSPDADEGSRAHQTYRKDHADIADATGSSAGTEQPFTLELVFDTGGELRAMTRQMSEDSRDPHLCM